MEQWNNEAIVYGEDLSDNYWERYERSEIDGIARYDYTPTNA
jgi:hypothetical protein